jgi:hypothetical protein
MINISSRTSFVPISLDYRPRVNGPAERVNLPMNREGRSGPIGTCQGERDFSIRKRTSSLLQRKNIPQLLDTFESASAHAYITFSPSGPSVDDEAERGGDKNVGNMRLRVKVDIESLTYFFLTRKSEPEKKDERQQGELGVCRGIMSVQR